VKDYDFHIAVVSVMIPRSLVCTDVSEQYTATFRYTGDLEALSDVFLIALALS
jgi:hypothetical protein